MLHHPQTTVLTVLPFEHKHVADEVIRSVREKDEARVHDSFARGSRINAGGLRQNYDLFDEINQKIAHLTTKRRYIDIKDGETFGILTFSPNATAVRDGKTIANHGDVYMTLWQADTKNHKLYCRTAWGAFSERPFKENDILIELNEHE